MTDKRENEAQQGIRDSHIQNSQDAADCCSKKPPRQTIAKQVSKSDLTTQHDTGEASDKRHRFRDILALVFRVMSPILALALLVWLLYRTGWNPIAQVATRVGVTGMVILVCLGIVESGCDALSLYYTSYKKISKRTTLTANSTGAVLNWFIPLEAGEVYKTAALARYGGSQRAAIAVLLWNYAIRWSGPGMAILAAFIGVLMDCSMNQATQTGIVAASLLALSPYLVIRVTLASGMLLRITSWLLQRLLRQQRAERYYQAIQYVHESVRTFRTQEPSCYRGLVITQLVAKLGAWMTVYAACVLMGLSDSFGQCALVYAALSVTTYVTAIFPARVGVSEGAAFVLFETIGLPGQYGLLLALIVRLRALLANGIVAVVGHGLGLLDVSNEFRSKI